MNEADKRRCNSLLASLSFAGGHALARPLRNDLEVVHGLAVTLDRVRADIIALADVGLVQRDGDLVRITQEGREVVMGLRELP